MNIMAGAHTVRIELIAGGRTRLDYVSYNLLPNSGVRQRPSTTWGRVKALYR